MNKIINFLKNISLNNIVNILISICSSVDSIFTYLLKRQKNKEKQEKEKKIDNYNKELEDTCNNGTLEQLLKIFSFMFTIGILNGCYSIELKTTNDWEGHYFTVQEFNERTKNIKLDKKESIWVLSNDTLYKLLMKKQEN